MSTAARLLSLEQFREQFQNAAKPNFEFWNGEARQKAMPTKLHAKLQRLLANVLAELGYFSFTELTLRIDANWEPVPDVAASAADFPGPYPTEPVDVVVEILSPQDSFTIVEQKCERYASSGILFILVFDPIERKAWSWDRDLTSLIRIMTATISIGAGGLDLPALWKRLDTER